MHVGAQTVRKRPHKVKARDQQPHLDLLSLQPDTSLGRATIGTLFSSRMSKHGRFKRVGKNYVLLPATFSSLISLPGRNPDRLPENLQVQRALGSF